MLAALKLCAVLLLGTGTVLHGQEAPASGTRPMAYEDHNQVDYKLPPLRVVKGRVHDEQGVSIAHVSLGLFTNNDSDHHKLVKVVESAADGTFRFNTIAPGRYRLVARYDGFCSPNARIEVSRHAPAKRGLDLHMEPPGLDTCSYATLDRRVGRR